jgi:hypothetical protein
VFQLNSANDVAEQSSQGDDPFPISESRVGQHAEQRLSPPQHRGRAVPVYER